MKKNLLNILTGIFSLSVVSAIAQPTITAAGINPTIGQSIAGVASATQTNPGSAGANQTWNFSSMTGSAATTSVVAPSSTPQGSNFPNATIAYNNSSPTYFKTSATAYQYAGAVNSAGVVQSYSDLEDYLRFPFTYNNTYTDAFACNYTSNSFPVYRTGTITVTADGYGTLITPHGTFTNVLRVKFIENSSDSMNLLGTPVVTSYVTEHYFWYKEGTHASLADILLVTVQGTTSHVSSYYTGPVGIDENQSNVSNYSVFPNPVTDKLNLTFDLSENKNLNIQIYNSLGALTKEFENELYNQGSNTMQVDVSGLPNGVYFVQIISEGIVAGNRRFVVSK